MLYVTLLDFAQGSASQHTIVASSDEHVPLKIGVSIVFAMYSIYYTEWILETAPPHKNPPTRLHFPQRSSRIFSSPTFRAITPSLFPTRENTTPNPLPKITLSPPSPVLSSPSKSQHNTPNNDQPNRQTHRLLPKQTPTHPFSSSRKRSTCAPTR